jgi:ribosomal protein S12 methylthiotransferase
MGQHKTVHLVSLGCPKNRVDSEVMLGHLAQQGYAAVSSPEDADVLVVNTCAFIDAAKEESVDAILELGEHKNKGRARQLIVAGCLSQRYAPDLAKEIPEVDHFLGTGNFEQIGELVQAGRTSRKGLPIVGQAMVSDEGHRREHGNHRSHPRLQGRNKLVPYRHGAESKDGGQIYIPDPDFSITAASPRLATTAHYTSYLKISEGCSNTCAFCVIPKLRGPQRSRTIDDIVEEFERGVDQGVVEFNLIAQDLCAYGKDLEKKSSLARLLRALEGSARLMAKPVWIRCLYAYPRGLTQEVVEVLAEAKFIVPYLDMPLQHISDSMLRAMRRGKGGEPTKVLLRKLKERIPHLILRTTFIAGMPGETEADFEELYDFCEDFRFERMGVFTYSREEDTPAAQMGHQVPCDIAEHRRDRLMALQKEISNEQQQSLIGQKIEVLVEGVSEETELLLQGRHKGQAPDIDGLTYITEGVASPGDVVWVKIEEASDYDIAGPIVARPNNLL